MQYVTKEVLDKPFEAKVPLVKQGSDEILQITFKNGQIIHESDVNLPINVCLIKGGLQFCVRGEPYLVQEGNILDLRESFVPKNDDAVLLTLVKAHGLDALREKQKCSSL